ncbi:unnamed protein product [Blepharisma stoltei]|uniref:Uncharacterized protein n=1 Tax=Blepharisma stoltei TaxID=1481888 RepID=A0AAU9J100_9CILI|nr:unnamed protein product [Blepharisma stoltei]
MGCCEGREASQETDKPPQKRSNYKSRKIRRNINVEAMLSQDFVVQSATQSPIRMQKENTDPEAAPKEDSQLFALNTLKADTKWLEISKWVYVTDKIDQNELKIRQSWAKSPETIGSLALAYLAEAAWDDPSSVQEILKNIQDHLILSIKSGTEDQRDFSFLFLYHSLDNTTNELKHELISKNILQNLIPFLSCQTKQLRLLSAATCARIYKGNEIAQSIFFKNKGAHDLIQLLIRDGDSDEILCRLLEHLIDLILDSNDEVIEKNAQKLIDESMMEMLESIDIHNRSLKVMEIADDLFQMMPEEEAKYN